MVSGAFRLLDARLRRAIGVLGYRRPTPVQEKAIPLVLMGFDVVVVAPMGSGKTEAALFPVLSRIVGEGLAGGGLVRAVYVTPLRSLNRDIFVRMERLSRMIGVELVVRHGDSPQAVKRAFLENPPDVMVTTPETLYFLLSVKRFREAVRGLRFVVVDELHELMGSKRGVELLLALERLEGYAAGRVQRIGLSATIRDPGAAARFLAQGRLVQVVDARFLEKRVSLRVVYPEPSGDDEVLAEKLGVGPGTAARVRFIAELVREEGGGVLVFTNTRDTAEVLGGLLKKVLGEDKVLVHHGSLSREERLRAEELFRKGELLAVVATSSLELGIDIGHARLVVQYLSPRQAVKLLQRVGRSGHRLGEESRGVLVASENFYDILESAVLAARGLRGDLEPIEPYPKPYDALVHQAVGALLERGKVSTQDIYWMASKTMPYTGLSMGEVEAIVDYMVYAGLAGRADGGLRPGRRSKGYYFTVTMIPDTRQYPVYDTVTRRRIGVLDEEFVAGLEEGELFVLAGRVWEVVSVEDNGVYVRPAERVELRPPAWEGDLIPVDWRAAREAGSILRRYETLGPRVLEGYPLDPGAREKLVAVIEEHRGRGIPLPTDKRIVIESSGELVVVHAFLGTRGAKALELLLSKLSSETMGYSPRSTSTPYTVVLVYASRVTAETVKNLLLMASRLPWGEVEELVREAARATGLYMWKLYHVAQRMGAVEKGARPDKRLLRRLADSIVGEEALREMEHDKLDLGVLRRLLEDIASGRVEVAAVDLDRPSPLAEQVLSEARMYDKLAEEVPATIIAEAVKRRLEARRVRLACLNCGYVWEARIGELPEKPRCPSCGAGFIAPTWLSREEAARLAELVRKPRLRGREKRIAEEHRAAADLVLTYGRRAVEALAATGVGPSTARQVLRRLVFGEEAFYKALVEAEQRYLRTRKYWRDRD